MDKVVQFKIGVIDLNLNSEYVDLEIFTTIFVKMGDSHNWTFFTKQKSPLSRLDSAEGHEIDF